MLLAAHPEWQSRARAEVLEVRRHQGQKPVGADTLRKLKTVTMVVQETLRLYLKDIKVKRVIRSHHDKIHAF